MNEVIVCCGDLVLQIVNTKVQFQTIGLVDKFKFYFYLSFFSRCNYFSHISANFDRNLFHFILCIITAY